MDDVLNALELQAREYRERMKLDVDVPLEVDVPIVDRYWRDFCYEATRRANARLALLADLGYFSDIDLLTRIVSGAR